MTGATKRAWSARDAEGCTRPPVRRGHRMQIDRAHEPHPAPRSRGSRVRRACAPLRWRTCSRIFSISFASVYPHYVTKVEKKGRTKADLDQVIGWLTGFDESELNDHLARARPSRTFSPLRESIRMPPRSPVWCAGYAWRTSRTPSCRRSATWTSWSTSSPRESRWIRFCERDHEWGQRSESA